MLKDNQITGQTDCWVCVNYIRIPDKMDWGKSHEKLNETCLTVKKQTFLLKYNNDNNNYNYNNCCHRFGI
jgi:hypothetical protein